VPKYLITKRYKKFILNLVYTIIGAAYLEIIVIYLAFIFLAELDARNMHPSILDVSNMAIMIYAVVFAHGFFETFKKYQHTTNQLKALTIESEKEKTPYLNIRSERQNKRINLNNTLYIESLADYIKIYTTDLDPIVSKQKISAIQEELPKSFLRIHRSFIINTKHISSFTKDSLSIGDQNLTISRTYKKDVLQALNKVG
jgi:DNA-binding LytR/AlgR family response regulator